MKKDAMKRYRTKWKEHVDYEWINKKINGHGGVYSFNKTNGIITISYIYGKNNIQLFWYNIILFIKYLIRYFKLKTNIGGKHGR